MVNKAKAETYAKDYALAINFIQYDDQRFDTPEMAENIAKWEGKYFINGGVLAFVVNGHYYATPCINQVKQALEESGFEYNSGVFCPFNAYFSFPGKLGPEGTKKLWRSAYYSDSNTFDGAARVIMYYQELKRVHIGYHRWNDLLKQSGNETMDAAVDRIIDEIMQNKKAYNDAAAQELGINLNPNQRGSK